MLKRVKPAEAAVGSHDDLIALAAALMEDVGGRKARRAFERTARDVVDSVIDASKAGQGRSDLLVEPVVGAAIQSGIQACLDLIRKRAADKSVTETLREEVTRKAEIVAACTNAHQHTAFTYKDLRNKPKPRKTADYLVFVERSLQFLDVRVNRNWLTCDPGPVLHERLSACAEADRAFFSAFFNLFCDEFAGLLDDLHDMLQIGRECQDLYILAQSTKEQRDIKQLQAKLIMFARRWTKFEAHFGRVASRFDKLRRDYET
jgi:hypothetical protein